MDKNNEPWAKATEEALKNEGKPKVESNEAVIENKEEIKPEIETKGEAPKEEKPTGEISEGISPEQLLKELNKLEFKVKGKKRTISSNEELLRLINLGFNYEDNARRLNEEKRKLEELKTQPQKEEDLFDYDEKQKEIEEKIKTMEEFMFSSVSEKYERELDEAVADLKSNFPSITDEELDAVYLELQNRLELIPKNKDVDLKNLLGQIYLEFNPSVINEKIKADIEKEVQKRIDEYKKSLSKNIKTEGGTSSAVKSGAKTPLSYEEAQKLAMEDEIFNKK